MLYAALRENRPKLKNSSRVIYARCAGLLLKLEQTVVYSFEEESAVHDVMSECRKVASMVQTGRDSANSSDNVSRQGYLLKKGGGHSRFGRSAWHKRYVIIRERVLYYYASEGMSHSTPDAPFGDPIGSMALNTAEVSKAPPSKYDHQFQV
jgi:hypothetical protein